METNPKNPFRFFLLGIIIVLATPAVIAKPKVQAPQVPLTEAGQS